MSQIEPDFQAALDDQEPDFEAIAKAKRRGRPIKPKQPPAPDPLININTLSIPNIDDDNNMMVLNDINLLNLIDKKAAFTRQELFFLEIWFNSPREKGKERLTIDKAMISAGYGNYQKTQRYYLARKITEKYEQSQPEASKIFAALGFGPVKTALGIIEKAENAKSEQVSLNALIHASKVHRMVDEKTDETKGIQINIITNAPAAAPGPGAPGAPVVVIPGQTEDDAPRPRKPLQISR